MLKRTVTLLILMAFVFSLFGCQFISGGQGGEQNGEPSKGENGSDESEDVIFSPSVSVKIIKSVKDVTTDFFALTDEIYRQTGNFATINTDDFPSEGNEIVVGDTNREISASARTYLDTQYKGVLDEYRSSDKFDRLVECFAIYSDGSSVAIAFTDSSVADEAVDYFVENYVTAESLSLEAGYAELVIVDGVDEIIFVQKSEQQLAWQEAEQVYGSEVISAIRAHLELFDERFYLWLAGLYEHETTDLSGNVIGGGFYYSNSARDNDSYSGVALLPDLESTSQVLSFLNKSGMLASTGLTQSLPDEMQAQLVSFARALQSAEDGYFYHPQWGSNISTSRRSRDCSWGATILTRLGQKPYWDTPSGTGGLYGAPGSSASPASLTLPIGQSSATAVSKVIAASDVWTGASHLATLDAWKSYLNTITLGIKFSSYSVGNTLASQNAQIKNRDRLAIKTGECVDSNADGIADGGYIETFKRIMDGLQLDNGLWESNVSYNSVNGLMKIATAYSNLGIAISKADKALEAAVYAVTSDEEADGITDVYNPWVSINTLLNNISSHGDAAISDGLREMIKDNAAAMITATTEKVAKFAKPDGSYSYNVDGSPYKSQGAIVAVRYTCEGDVNGGTIAFTGIWSSMCGVLEIDILPFGYEDFIKFIKAVDYGE